MADSQDPTGQAQQEPKKTGGEVTAEDLLGLWGMQQGSSQKTEPRPMAPTPPPPQSISSPQPASQPLISQTPAVSQSPAVAQQEAQKPQPSPQQTAQPQKNGVSAEDLLSLWGGGESQKKPPQPPIAPAATASSLPPPPPRPIPPPPPRPVAPPPPAAAPPAPPRPILPPRQSPLPPPPPIRPTPPPPPRPTPEKLVPPPPPRPSAPLPQKKTPVPPPPVHREEIKKESSKALEGEIVPPKKEKKEPEKAPKEEISKASAPPQPPQPPPPSEPEMLDEEEPGFGRRFDEFLHELNISRGQIFKALGCLVLLGALIAGGIYGWRYYKGRSPEAPPQGEQEKEKVSDEDTGIPGSEKIAEGILPTNVDIDTAVSVVTEIGAETEGRTRLSADIMTFRRLQNAYGADVNQLLDQATDRRAALQSHLNLLKKLRDEGTQINARIAAEMSGIEVEFKKYQTDQETSEAQFFDKLAMYNALGADELLDSFIKASREVVSLRARFRALQKLNGFFAQALPKLEKRIRDIELNAEALISGIKVYDVTGSDIELIVPVNGAQTSSSEARKSQEELGASPVLFPTHPAQVKTDKDFITEPSGGFGN